MRRWSYCNTWKPQCTEVRVCFSFRLECVIDLWTKDTYSRRIIYIIYETLLVRLFGLLLSNYRAIGCEIINVLEKILRIQRLFAIL